MKRTPTIPETFVGIGYTRDHAGLPLETVRVPVPKPAIDQVLIRVVASSLNPLEYKLADLIFLDAPRPSFSASTFPASSWQQAAQFAPFLSETLSLRWPI